MSRQLATQRQSQIPNQAPACEPVQTKSREGLRGMDFEAQLQFLRPGGASTDGVHAAAARGIGASGGAMPYMDSIQKSFGRHDVSQVQAHVGGAAKDATAAMGATAYATTDRGGAPHVAFGQAPDLHTAAHEAAHVVQQKAGVQLKGGVGAAGDAYETHADRVADAVVQGKSAESLLDQYAGGGGSASRGQGEVQREEDGADWKPKIDEKMRNTKDKYQGFFEKQALACEVLSKTAGKEDPPPFWQDLCALAVELALVAATGGIGSAVGIGVVKRLTKKAIDPKAAADAIKIVGDMAKDTTKAAVKKIGSAAYGFVESKASQYPEGDSERAAKICFDAQKATLIDSKTDAMLQYNAQWRNLTALGGQAGFDAASAAYDEVADQYNRAEAIQRNESIQKWAAYQAQGKRGSHKGDKKKGTDMARRGFGFGDDLGVLELQGSWHDGDYLFITSASMDGMNAPLRKHVAGKAIRDLHVPIKVKLAVGSKDKPSFARFRLNEKRTIWVEWEKGPGILALARQTGTGTQEVAARRWYTKAANPIAAAQATFKELSVMRPPLK